MKLLHYTFDISMIVLQVVLILMKFSGNDIIWGLVFIPFYLILIIRIVTMLCAIVVTGSMLVIRRLIKEGLIESTIEYDSKFEKFDKK